MYKKIKPEKHTGRLRLRTKILLNNEGKLNIFLKNVNILKKSGLSINFKGTYTINVFKKIFWYKAKIIYPSLLSYNANEDADKIAILT